MKQDALDYELQIANATGMFQGAPTLQAKQMDFENQLAQAKFDADQIAASKKGGGGGGIPMKGGGGGGGGTPNPSGGGRSRSVGAGGTAHGVGGSVWQPGDDRGRGDLFRGRRRRI